MKSKSIWLWASLLMLAAAGLFTLWQAYQYLSASEQLGSLVFAGVKIVAGIFWILLSSVCYTIAKERT